MFFPKNNIVPMLPHLTFVMTAVSPPGHVDGEHPSLGSRSICDTHLRIKLQVIKCSKCHWLTAVMKVDFIHVTWCHSMSVNVANCQWSTPQYMLKITQVINEVGGLFKRNEIETRVLFLTLESEVKVTEPLERTIGWVARRIQETCRSGFKTRIQD